MNLYCINTKFNMKYANKNLNYFFTYIRQKGIIERANFMFSLL